MTQPEGAILAAGIAALAAILSAFLSYRVTTRVNKLNGELEQVIADKTREAELVVNTLNHLVGGSQERTAGLATLNLLKTEAPIDRWISYENFVQKLLKTAMIYVLTAGRNRWQAHEIENIREMADWFKKDEELDFGDLQPRVRAAANSYIADWRNRPSRSATPKAEGDKEDGRDKEGRPNDAAVNALIEDLKRWVGAQEPATKTVTIGGPERARKFLRARSTRN